MSTLVESLRDGRVLRLTLNRPAKRNALDAALCRELADALEAADRDPGVGAILLDAAGKSFCAGMDLAEITAATPADEGEINDLHERLFTIGTRVTTPIVAAIHGAALAGGTGLVANCHIAVATPDATFGLTEVRIGLWPFLVYRAVAAAMGDRRTLELALTGRIFVAPEARDLGLVHEVTADAAARAAEIARQIAAFSPVAIQKGLGFVHQSRGLTMTDTAALARQVRNQVFASPGFREGIRAFLESRVSPAPGPRPPTPSSPTPPGGQP